ncbi:MAG TPA: fatty acyl-AMP ligase [Stenomitos sp.]
MQITAPVPTAVRTLVDVLRWRALHEPDRRAYTFLIDGDAATETLTFAQLDARARAIALTLQERLAVGDRAMLLYPAGLDFVAAFMGCCYAGVVAVPVYPPKQNRDGARLAAIAQDAQATVALTLDKHRPLIQGFPELTDLSILATDDLPSAEGQEWHGPALNGDDLAFLQYTSGSTGLPKGVMVSHGNLLHNEQMMHAAFETTPESVWVSWLPLFHDMGLILGMLHAMYVGSHCVLMAPVAFIQRPMRWLQAMSRYRATHSVAPNFAYELCLRRLKPELLDQLDLSAWRLAGNAAEPVRADTLERFAAAMAPCGFRMEALRAGYGLAEGTVFVTCQKIGPRPTMIEVSESLLSQGRVAPPLTAEDTKRLVGNGTTWHDQHLLIVDPETGCECPPDRVGEIWLSGPSVARGYWNRPEATAQTFGAHVADTGAGPYLRTGDLGFLKDGDLFITGRLKDLIIIRGRNHYPQDIERTMEEAHPSVRPGCTAAFSVEVAGEERLVVVAEVERRYQSERSIQTEGNLRAMEDRLDSFELASSRLAAEEVLGVIRQAVAEQHELMPHEVVLIQATSIPKTSSGKIQRSACRALYLEGSLKRLGPR